MYTIAIAELKAHLSGELKKVRLGETITILDRKQPIARIVPLSSALVFSRKSLRKPAWKVYTQLISVDPINLLDAERADSW